MALEGMTGENAEPYFTREDMMPTVIASRAASLLQTRSSSRLFGTSLSNFGDSSLAP